MVKQIKHRYTGQVLYEYDSGLSIRQALEKATAEKVNLCEANLRGANLSWANLSWANLSEANLCEADLRGANLYEANLSWANLSWANLSWANLSWANLYEADLYEADLRGANLSGADLSGANLGEHGKLIGGRPFFQCGPIGSRSDYLMSFITDKGIVIKAGCFTGTIDEFREAVEKTHGDNDHGKEYAMAMLMIEAHAAIWTPKGEA